MRDFKVILVDDDADLLDVLKLNLKDDFRVQAFSDANAAVQYMDTNHFDALVLDYHMPGKNSFQLFQDLRNRKYHQPVIFLTGDSTPELKIEGLELGVDDFLHKPITTVELGAHLRNRIKNFRSRHPNNLKIHNLEIDPEFPEVKISGENIPLTKKEFQILTVLAFNLNTIVKKEDMVRRVWKDVTVEENNLDTHLSNLRRKIKGFQGKIKTLKGFGYILKD
jgi:DNA-binding response OmpR family regulator